MDELAAKIEAVLFAHGEPMSIERLSQILEVSPDDVKSGVNRLAEVLTQEVRGVVVITRENEVQLGTKSQFGPIVEKLFQEEFRKDLTPAALETLSIVSYRGPISRPEIDSIRGVNSSFMLRSLMLRGLIDREPDPKRHNVWLYKPSFEFLKLLGLERIEDLPEFQSLNKALNDLDNKTESENI